MKCWPILLFLFTACQQEGMKPCSTELSSSAVVDVPDFRDTLQLGEQMTAVMDFFPQDSRGKMLVLPLDYGFEWGIELKRLDWQYAGRLDTLTYNVVAEQGELKSIGPTTIVVKCARSGNMQQARISFSLMKPGRYSVRFFRGNSSALISEWGKCKTYVSFDWIFVLEPKGLNPDDASYTLFVKP